VKRTFFSASSHCLFVLDEDHVLDDEAPVRQGSTHVRTVLRNSVISLLVV
jgi:hypothetical protein